MLERLRFIASIILPVLGIVVPVVLYYSSIPKRSLVFEVVSKTDLVGSLEGIEGVEISVGGAAIKEAALYVVKMKNTGTQPIAVNDFERPMKIEFEGDVYAVKIKEIIPENLSLGFAIEKENVVINPLLFNQNESFSLEILSSSRSYPTIDSRVSGISEVEESYPAQNQTARLIVVLILSFLLQVFYAKSIMWLLERGDSSGLISKAGNLLLGLTCAFSSILLTKMVVDISAYKWILSVLVVIPIVLGCFWALMEIRHIKQHSASRPEKGTPISSECQ